MPREQTIYEINIDYDATYQNLAERDRIHVHESQYGTINVRFEEFSNSSPILIWNTGKMQITYDTPEEHSQLLELISPLLVSPKGESLNLRILKKVDLYDKKLDVYEFVKEIRDAVFDKMRRDTALTSQSKRDELSYWVQEARSRWQKLVNEELSHEKPSRYSKGIWTVAYLIEGDIKPFTRTEFLDVLRKVEGHETGWPPWWIPDREGIKPYPYDGVIECWLGPKGRICDAAHSDFWRASPKGMMFLLRGYDEDSHPDMVQPGQILDLILPVWRIGECLLHARSLANVIAGQSSSVLFRVTWEGLSGRTLRSLVNRSRILFNGGVSKQDSVTSEIKVEADTIDKSLHEIVAFLTQPLYEVFEFFKPPASMVGEELLKMLGAKR